jgi:niacin transporter
MLMLSAQQITVRKITISALLIAIGLVIPLFSPIKILLEPASFTLASHVPIFIAMFLSPWIGVAVALCTALGFLMSMTPVIAARALSHVVFAVAGGFWLGKRPQTLDTIQTSRVFSFLIALVHAICELIVVGFFYFGGSMTPNWGVYNILLLVGLGTIVHSLVDFEIALAIKKALGARIL